jgi:hypothetical protein
LQNVPNTGVPILDYQTSLSRLRQAQAALLERSARQTKRLEEYNDIKSTQTIVKTDQNTREIPMDRDILLPDVPIIPTPSSSNVSLNQIMKNKTLVNAQTQSLGNFVFERSLVSYFS